MITGTMADDHEDDDDEDVWLDYRLTTFKPFV
jgi:hypothetical protein